MDFSTLWRRTTPKDWSHDLLSRYRVVQLEFLAKLLGIPHSGTKDQLIDRLIRLGRARELLRPYEFDEGNHDAQVATVRTLAAHYTGRELRALCRTVGAYAPSNKYGMAASLLGWRNTCRQAGVTFREEFERQLAERPAVQLRLPLVFK